MRLDEVPPPQFGVRARSRKRLLLRATHGAVSLRELVVIVNFGDVYARIVDKVARVELR